ncbi:DotU family type IV/VI secretion system protein [Chitinasiproducens palmae]|uniref:Type IV / VI secretion system protein, DotU family n=1 Tax=Chitinasiproducens palmae TaxID=1770053 RepID=A0A1H2PKY9_9BURK|nr:DotU family type IV/VI secretion system protein [Chitinasiproducens palmae]SDV47122.1 type IV / VI secretion system protein, DotU family [Chitinasiproducens palmae]
MQLIDTLIPIVALVQQTIAAPVGGRQPVGDRPSPGGPAQSGLEPAQAVPASRTGGTASAGAAPPPGASAGAGAAAAASPFAPVPVGAVDWPGEPARPLPGGGKDASTPASVQEPGAAPWSAPTAPAFTAASAAPGTSARAAQSATASGSAAMASPARTLADRLDALIDTARYAAAREDISPATFDEGLFAVLAWADEILISSTWPGAAQWPRYLLQRKYFNSTTAGLAFFARLEQLRDDQADVREVYALCLSLGFKGRFAYERSTRALDETRRATLQRVLDDAGVPTASSALLFPQAYASADTRDPDRYRPETAERRLRPRFAITRQTALAIGIPLVVLALLYGTYRLIIAQLIDAILPLIK